VCLDVDRPYLIGVAGGSNSGKTTIAERMEELIGSEELSLIRLDSYYITMRDEPIEVRAAFNYDHPDAFDWDLLNLHLQRLTAGESVEVPIYDYTIYDRTDQFELVVPGKVVVVEGILVLWEPRLRGMLGSRCSSTPRPTCVSSGVCAATSPSAAALRRASSSST
jgi:uridine kinase